MTVEDLNGGKCHTAFFIMEESSLFVRDSAQCLMLIQTLTLNKQPPPPQNSPLEMVALRLLVGIRDVNNHRNANVSWLKSIMRVLFTKKNEDFFMSEFLY